MGKKKEQLNWLTSMTSSPKKKGTAASTAALPKQLEDALDDDGLGFDLVGEASEFRQEEVHADSARHSGEHRLQPG